MHIDRAHSAQVGDHNTQNNTFANSRDTTYNTTHNSTDNSIHNTTDNSTHHTTHKKTQVKFSVPVLGPVLSLAYAHPLIAALMAAVVVGGGGAAINASLPDSTPSPSTALVRGFVMKSDGQKAPQGYDFTHAPPVVADAGTDAIYLQGSSLYATNGKLAGWSTSAVPTAEGCRDAVAEHPVRAVYIGVTSVVCYLDRNGDPGYISVTALGLTSATVDTAHLR
ncbi:hypothetical protein OG562_43175 [Streptomyces sp. NBC_01275]|uniref:hypothetical protein n=1 Tax=Streptomyces sp. NBC_01275 TaxID=2903807 RepID=UPI00225043A5|nr:hypothetical protein [Streptomyces sp. NBC_01275]MCX4767643.1 hypothetical protein [Streptomyces sp. NBC_01275]